MQHSFQITPFNSWVGFSKLPYIISGPCSAETEEQVHQTVKELVAHNSNISILRAGIWKPRTRPDAFEGVGAIGLTWIKDAGNEVGLPVTIEVANAKHVEEALMNEIDVLWIGARTTVNPFVVQEIADALKGVDIPVMVKNPVNPDLELWIGAIERLNRVGINKLAAIHRGFSTYEKTIYRNRPSWEIPIELRRRIPELPIIGDPSHICGRRDLLQSVSQKAMDLNFDGLMIESHTNPDKAWSDAKQQVTPKDLRTLLSNLTIRRTSISENGQHELLHGLRANIDRIDNYLLELIAERMEIVSEVGKYKDGNNIAIYQPERWAETVKNALKIAESNGLTEEFILNLFQQIHKESIHHQTKVMNDVG